MTDSIELKEFVAESICQIIDGIVAAQAHAKEMKARINPPTHYDSHGHLISSNDSTDKPCLEKIEFDIDVIATEGGEAKAGLGVLAGAIGIGTNSTLSGENKKANRIKFSVMVDFPVQIK